jgi:carboxypeptidase Q
VLPKTSCCIVHDTGPGKVIGLGIGGRPAAQKILEHELACLKELGVTDFTSRSGGGSDHVAFEAKGVPGFALRQQTRDYFLYTHHSQADTLERASAPDLIQGAQVMATMALRIANLAQLLPREKK